MYTVCDYQMDAVKKRSGHSIEKKRKKTEDTLHHIPCEKL
jgi:hypothetical protein